MFFICLNDSLVYDSGRWSCAHPAYGRFGRASTAISASAARTVMRRGVQEWWNCTSCTIFRALCKVQRGHISFEEIHMHCCTGWIYQEKIFARMGLDRLYRASIWFQPLSCSWTIIVRSWGVYERLRTLLFWCIKQQTRSAWLVTSKRSILLDQ
jgi:hypothetical protein